MMKNPPHIRVLSCLATLLILLQVSAFAQAVKCIETRFPHSRQVAERYFVLKSNKTIRHGTYTSYFYRDKKQIATSSRAFKAADFIKQQGDYIDGKKQGNWMEYSDPGVLYTSGNYDHDKKTGAWSTSKEHGEVLEKFDYTTRQHLVPEIHIPLHYPPRARAAGVQGTVVLSFQVESDCTVKDIKILQSLHPDCDKEAMQNLLKFYEYLKKYGPPDSCPPKSDTFTIHFTLD